MSSEIPSMSSVPPPFQRPAIPNGTAVPARTRTSLGKVIPWLAVAKRMLLIVSPFLAIITVLLWLAILSIDILAAGRAYVEGESLWSKSQKEAVVHLLRFAETRSKADYRNYEKALRVPLGFHRARLELEKPDRNASVLWASFLEGGTHPDDVPGVISLYDRFHTVSYMKRVLEIWRTGDDLIARLQVAAEELHAYYESGRGRPSDRERILNRIVQLNDELRPWQNLFSTTLGEATRWLQSILLLVLMTAAGTLVPIGILLTQRMVHRVDRAERDLENMMETVPDVIFRLDRHGRFIRWNTRLEQVTGLTSNEIQGTSAVALFADADRPLAEEAFQRALATGYAETEAKLQSKERNAIPYHWAGSAVRHADGTVVGLTAVGRNLTEHTHLEEQLRQAQKMEAIGQLAGGIAHDFNNLLTVINGYTQLLLDELDPADSRRAHLMVIRQAGGRAASMTHQLLTFSRKQVLSPTVLDLNAVLAGMIQMLGRLLGEDITLQVHADPSLWPIKADPGQIEQVIMNLAVNARDAMPQGGRLTIETRNIQLDKLQANSPADVRPGSYVLLATSDTGHGMDRATQIRIFEPFFTTKEQGKGTGLGLSTVYGIVKQSGGSIDVQSAVGQGTTFELYFPRTMETVEPTETLSVSEKTPRGSETILLVEDEEHVRALAAAILRPKGYTVLEAGNADEALLLCRRYDGPVHLLATDVIMPGMSGKELADRLTALRPGVNVLFLSGYPVRSIIGQGVQVDGDHFLQKPYTPQSLLSKIREVLDNQDKGRSSPSHAPVIRLLKK
jgi:PAS domain S-box-containing protein